MKTPWFTVDKDGLAKLLETRGKEFALFELAQNCWDEEVAEVRIDLAPVGNGRRGVASLRVEDDSPEGFADLSHAYTMFAESAKKVDPTKRGRFNLGEKLVLALCNTARVYSTTGEIRFGPEGRRKTRAPGRKAGTVFEAEIRMTKPEVEKAIAALSRLIPPSGVSTYVNGREIALQAPLRRLKATLVTEVSDSEGRLKRTARKTDVELYRANGRYKAGRRGTIYEMGIPVVEHDAPFDVNVFQKVPLGLDRNSVTPAYLRSIRALILDHAYTDLKPEESKTGWVTDGLEKARPEAVRRVVEHRFGKKAVIFDPSSPEANKIAADTGRKLVYGKSFPKKVWSRIRESEILKPAGQVIETRVKSSPDGEPPIPWANWTGSMVALAVYARLIGSDLLGQAPIVQFYRIGGSGYAGRCNAWWGGNTISFNLARFRIEGKTQQEIDELLIHEFAHRRASDHLSEAFYSECCRLGAKLRSSTARWEDHCGR